MQDHNLFWNDQAEDSAQHEEEERAAILEERATIAEARQARGEFVRMTLGMVKSDHITVEAAWQAIMREFDAPDGEVIWGAKARAALIARECERIQGGNDFDPLD